MSTWLILEDEAVASRTLARLLRELAPAAQIELTLVSVTAAIERLRREPQPALIFVDVQLADGLCFEIFESVNVQAKVIFVTAYDSYAIKAFELGGIDYLLKPVDPVRLAQALARVEQASGADWAGTRSKLQRSADAYRLQTRRWKSRFLVQQGEVLMSVPCHDIAWFQLDLVPKLMTRDGRRLLLAYSSLDEIEPLLDPSVFFRLNRRVIAHIDAISRASRLFKGRLQVDLLPPCNEEIVVSQARAAQFRNWWEGESGTTQSQ